MLPKQNTMAAKSKEEYLKRYISGADADDKKKKKKKKEKIAKLKNKSNVRIVDDDVDFQSLLPSNLKNTLDEDIGDDDPIVAEFVDERPDVVKQLELYRKNTKWKTLESDEESSCDKHGQSDKSHRRHDSDSDHSVEQSTRHDSDSNFSRIRSRSPGYDSSPLRENRHDSDQSPPRRKRHDSDSDQSPPRRKRHDSDPDQSPPRRTRHDSDSDQSPPRKKRHDSDSDQSPPRRKRHDSDSDQSPPRISRKGRNSHSDQLPSRRGQARSESDQLSSRIKREHSTRHSPNRSKHTKAPNEVKSKHHHGDLKIRTEVDERGRAKQTLGGAKAGLQSARDMKEEARKLRSKEDLAFSQMDADLLGKDAKTVFRDKKSGKKRNMKAEAEEERQKQEKQAEKEAKYQKWGKGMKQAEQQQVSLDQAMHEASKPLARYKDDQDLDSLLRDQDREGDPMLAFIKKKKSKTASGQERPVYKGPEPPPNRFKIRPGYRWDGVDRSNGFERQFFAKKSEKNAIKDIAYKWSVEDM